MAESDQFIKQLYVYMYMYILVNGAYLICSVLPVYADFFFKRIPSNCLIWMKLGTFDSEPAAYLHKSQVQ